MIYLNPIYGLRNENGCSFIYLTDKSIEYVIDKYSNCLEIPPLYGYILSQFQNPISIKDILFNLEKTIGIRFGVFEKFIKKITANENSLKFKYRGEDFILPPNLLIEADSVEFVSNVSSCEYFNPFQVHKSTRPSVPLGVTIMLTSKCKTNCIYCYADRNMKVDFPLDKMLEIIDDCYSSGVLSLTLSGGDIFAYNEWGKVIDNMYKYNYRSFISTKIPLVEDDVYFLYLRGIRNIQFSLDSIDSRDLKNIVGQNQQYIDKVRAMFKACSKYKIKLNIRSVLSKYNAQVATLDALYQELCKCQINSWVIVPAFLSYYKQEESDYRATEEAIVACKKFIKTLESDSNFKIVFSEKLTPDNIKYTQIDDFLLYNKGCNVTSHSMSINVNGLVTVCEMLYNRHKFHMGDAKSLSIKDLWNSKIMKNFFKFELSPLKRNTESACYKCNEFKRCKIGNVKRVCLVDVVNVYGEDKWDYPDPRCPHAPEGNLDLLLM